LAAHRPPAPVSAPAPTSLHRLRLPGPPPPAARNRLLQLRPPRLGGSQARFSRAIRCAAEASAVARAGEDRDGDGDDAAAGAGIWEQVRDIVVFAGPALGLWICGPLMSLIDTMVIGQTSALQLAALGLLSSSLRMLSPYRHV
jgi:hypothetical protein